MTRAAHYRVDIHSASRNFEVLPQVRLYAPTVEEYAMASLFRLPAVIESAIQPTPSPPPSAMPGKPVVVRIS